QEFRRTVALETVEHLRDGLLERLVRVCRPAPPRVDLCKPPSVFGAAGGEPLQARLRQQRGIKSALPEFLLEQLRAARKIGAGFAASQRAQRRSDGPGQLANDPFGGTANGRHPGAPGRRALV